MSERASRAPRAKTGGRPTSSQLTAKSVAQICELVATGVPQEAAAGSLGIPRRTFQDWLRRGRAEGAREPYRSLAENLQLALDRYHASRVVQLHRVGSDDPKVLQWELERRFKDDWSDPHRGGVSVQVNVQTVVESPAFAEVMEAIWAALRHHPAAHAEVESTIAQLVASRPEPLQLTA